MTSDPLAVDLEAWQRQALPLGDGQGNEHQLVETVRVLLGELQRDARRILEQHLARCDEHNDRAARLSDTDDQLADPQINALRERVLVDLRNNNPAIGLNEPDFETISTKLQRLEQDPRAYTSQRDLLDDLLVVINTARLRKYANRPRAAQPWRNLEELPNLNDRMLAYSERVLALHQRRATLRQTYRADLSVREDYDVWVSLVQETMLGGQDERQRRDEFALQAAYVVFIRLLLIRVCEDKGIFPHRFLSDGSLPYRNICSTLLFSLQREKCYWNTQLLANSICQRAEPALKETDVTATFPVELFNPSLLQSKDSKM